MEHAKLAFNLQELNNLLKDEYSCIKVVKGGLKHLALHPYFLNNFTGGVRETLDSGLTKLDGILLYYRNPKLTSNVGGISYESLHIHLDVLADFYLFCPAAGKKLKCVVNKKSNDHVGCLAHQIFNITVSRPNNDDESYENWPGKYVKIGQEVVLNVTHTNFEYAIPYIRAEFDPNEDYGKCTEEDSGISTCEDLKALGPLQTFMNAAPNKISNTSKDTEDSDTEASVTDDDSEIEDPPKTKKRKRDSVDIDLRPPKKKKKIKAVRTDDVESDEDCDLSFSEIYPKKGKPKEDGSMISPKKLKEDISPNKVKVSDEQSDDSDDFVEMLSKTTGSERMSQSPKKVVKGQSPVKNKNAVDPNNDDTYLESNEKNKKTHLLKNVKDEYLSEINSSFELKSPTKSPKKLLKDHSRPNNRTIIQASSDSEYSESDNEKSNSVPKQSSPEKSQKNNLPTKNKNVPNTDSDSEWFEKSKENILEHIKQEKSPKKLSKSSNNIELDDNNEDRSLDDKYDRKIFVKIPKTPKKKQDVANLSGTTPKRNVSVESRNISTPSSNKKIKLEDYFVKTSKKTVSASQNSFTIKEEPKEESDGAETGSVKSTSDDSDTVRVKADAVDDRRETMNKDFKTPEKKQADFESNLRRSVEKNASGSDGTVGSAKRKKSKLHRRDMEIDEEAQSILANIVRTTLHQSENEDRLTSPTRVPTTPQKKTETGRVSENVDGESTGSAKRKKSKKHKKDIELESAQESILAEIIKTTFSDSRDSPEANTSYAEETTDARKKKSKKRSKENSSDKVQGEVSTARQGNSLDSSLPMVGNSDRGESDASFKREKKKKKKRSKDDSDDAAGSKSVDVVDRADKMTKSEQKSGLEDSFGLDISYGPNDSKKEKKKKKKKSRAEDEVSTNVNAESNASPIKDLGHVENFNASKMDVDESEDEFEKNLQLLLANIEKAPSSSRKSSSKKSKKSKSDRPETSERGASEENPTNVPVASTSKQNVGDPFDRPNGDTASVDVEDDLRALLIDSVKKSLKKKESRRKSESTVTGLGSTKAKSRRKSLDASTPARMENSFEFGVPNVTSTAKKESKRTPKPGTMAAFREELRQRLC